MKRILIAFVALFVVAFSGVAFSADNQDIIMGTGGTSGTYYAMGGSLAQLYTNNGYPAIAQTTDASVANLRLMARNRINMAWTQNDIAHYRYHKMFIFEKDKGEPNFSAMASLFPEVLQIVVSKGSGIKSVSDLRGKKIGVGAPGSSAIPMMKLVLDAFGMSFKDIKPEYLAYGEAASQFQDRLLDAFVVSGPVPHAAIQSIAPLMDLDFVRFSNEEIDKVREKVPFFVAREIEAGSYNGIDEDVLALGVTATLVVRNDLSEAEVYDLLKLMVDNLEYLHSTHHTWKKVSLDTIAEGITIPFHPGAKKFLMEKGIKVN
jgi:TRAP transporter TAXI family solute receptor